MLADLVLCRKRDVQPKDRLWKWLMAVPQKEKRRPLSFEEVCKPYGRR